MKVLNLRCANGHGFEGWFASDDDFMQQNGGGRIECPLCADHIITRMPAAPRLNLSGAREPPRLWPLRPKPCLQPHPRCLSPPTCRPPGCRPCATCWPTPRTWASALPNAPAACITAKSRTRGIRGQATPEDRAALLDEGIETMAIPVPHALKGPVQ
jgi:hypothetical protein